MGSQVSAKTNDKEQQLKKASKMALIRSLLPIVGLVVIFLLFNVLTDFRMMGNMSLVLSQVYVTMIPGNFTFPHQSCFRGLWRRFARTFLTCAAFSAIVSSVVLSILSQ